MSHRRSSKRRPPDGPLAHWRDARDWLSLQPGSAIQGPRRVGGRLGASKTGSESDARANPAAIDDIRVVAIVVVASVALVYCLPVLVSPAWLILPLGLCLLGSFPGRLLLAVTAAVMAWTLIDAEARLTSRLPAAADGTIHTVTGRVTGLPKTGPFRTRFRLSTLDGAHRYRLSWYEDAPALKPGDCVRVRAKLSTPHGSANPGEFDYTAWLWREGIDATGYVREPGHCARPPVFTLDRVRADALARIAPALVGEPMRGIIEALTLGVRQHISDAQWQVLRATGTSHLVAISGLHIGLVAGLLFLMARWLSLRTRFVRHATIIACVTAFAGAAGYAALAGWALPTQRALIMVAVGLIAVAGERQIAAGRALAWAALLVVTVDPAAVTTPGFWLSFGAVAWLIWIATMARGPWWLRWLWFQLGLVVTLAPITLWFFGKASFVAPIVNAVLIPLSTLFVPATLVSVALALLWPAAGGVLLTWLAKGFDAGWSLLAVVAHYNAVTFEHVFSSAWLMLLAALALCWLALPLPARLRALGVVMLLPAVLGYRPATTTIAPGRFVATVLDVGQGLAVVVRTARHTLVFDAGPAYRTGFDAGAMIVVPYLRYIGRRHIDRLVISHGDRDHIGGAHAIMKTLAVDERLGAGSALACRAGMTWRWDGVDFVVGYPDADARRRLEDDNDLSCVLRVASARASLLLPGDIEAPAERYLLDHRRSEALASDVLVMPHHGSATSSSPAFLDTVAPRLAIVSAGWHNRWGFPKPAVIDRYRARGIRVANTATSGAITIRWPQAHTPRVTRWRVTYARFWQVPSPNGR